MPCKKIGNAIICYNRAYKYKSIYFELHEYLGPIRLNNDGEVSNMPMGRKFFKEFDEWSRLSDEQKAEYEVTDV